MHGLVAFILTVLAVVIYVMLFVFPPKGNPSVTDWFIVIFTVVASGVAAIQVLVSRRQAELMKKTLEATQKSADAATTAANAMQALERSRIVVEPAAAPVYLQDPMSERDNKTLLRIDYSAMNRGKSPATVLDNFVKIEIVPTDCVPTQLPMPPAMYSSGRRPMAVLVGKGVNYEATVGIRPEELRWVIDHSLSLLLYGAIEYEDVFGNRRIHSFAWKYTFLPQKHPSGDFKRFSDHDWFLEPGPDEYFQRST